MTQFLPYTGESFKRPARVVKKTTHKSRAKKRIDSLKSTMQVIIVSLLFAFLIGLTALQIVLFA